MPQQLNPQGLLQLRIELRDIEPVIWRCVLVPDTITLVRLHAVIQAAMGWWDSHLHEFDIAGLRYGMTDPDWDLDPELIDEARKNFSRFWVIAGSSTTSMTLAIPGCIESRWRGHSR